jgi:hypothetical protein
MVTAIAVPFLCHSILPEYNKILKKNSALFACHYRTFCSQLSSRSKFREMFLSSRPEQTDRPIPLPLSVFLKISIVIVFSGAVLTNRCARSLAVCIEVKRFIEIVSNLSQDTYLNTVTKRSNINTGQYHTRIPHYNQ